MGFHFSFGPHWEYRTSILHGDLFLYFCFPQPIGSMAKLNLGKYTRHCSDAYGSLRVVYVLNPPTSYYLFRDFHFYTYTSRGCPFLYWLVYRDLSVETFLQKVLVAEAGRPFRTGRDENI